MEYSIGWLVSNAFYKVLYMLFYRVYTRYARVIIYKGILQGIL